MTIRILYAKPKKWFVPISWLIRKVEGTYGSHVAIEFLLGESHAVFDSVAPKSRLLLKYRWDEHYLALNAWEFTLAEGNVSPAISWALDNTDKDYSRLQCVLIGIGEFFGGWVQKLVWKQNPNGSEYLICVEAAARFCTQFLGLKFSSGPDVLGLKEFIDTLDQYTEK